ncbi:MAG: isoprenyl transferase [Clostridium sp.]|uniref:isoprenyl transferase n=1 Tax=Clostridium sp. TaxID=1506 RepID=UPI002A8BFF37|nr:isoprenyl transferase [Clostridium sp.]MDY5098173.1 isoprenyl transferase [Clostridium sp.]
MKFFREKKVDIDENIDRDNIPKHIAIIMDGNGRWAKKRGLPRTLGHKAGVETIRNIVKECSRLNIKYLTLYAFSTENWKRPPEEVNALMKLLVEYLKSEFEELNNNDVVINSIGNIDRLPEVCRNELRLAHEKTKNNEGVVLNLALNYGGRDEILHAINSLVKDLRLNNLKETTITEEIFERYLYTASMPDPDLIIRPSGELRLSNFLLWQCAYSEFWYSDICWPDFKPKDLRKAIIDYQKRSRRFGGLK